MLLRLLQAYGSFTKPWKEVVGSLVFFLPAWSSGFPEDLPTPEAVSERTPIQSHLDLVLSSGATLTHPHANRTVVWLRPKARWLSSKNPPARQETLKMPVPSLGQKGSLEKEMATHSGILAWEISWRQEPGGLQPMGLQRVRHDWVTEHAQTHARSRN